MRAQDLDDGEFNSVELVPLDGTFIEADTRIKSATPQAQKQLDELVRDFNLLFGGRTKTAIVTNTAVWHQIQTLDGPYERNAEGDWVQRGKCETLRANNSFRGIQDFVNRLTVEDGKAVTYTTYTTMGQSESYGPALIERVANGIRTRSMEEGGGGWGATDYYRLQDGSLGSTRTWREDPEVNDLWFEVDSPQAAAAAKKKPAGTPAAPATAATGIFNTNDFGPSSADAAANP